MCGDFVFLFVNMYKGLLSNEYVCVLWFIVPIRNIIHECTVDITYTLSSENHVNVIVF